MPTVTITHADGSTETIPATISWSHEREIGKMRKLKVTVDRDQARAVTLEQKSDAVELSGVTEGRLVNVEKGGSTWTLVVYSYEWDAKQVEPTAGGTTTTGTDDAIITDLVNDVGAWSVGSIASFTNQMTFVFNHAFRHEALRRVERNVPGELRWNDDASVDYVDSLGSDKTGSVTLSAANGNLDGEISIKDQGRDFDATHIRLIGAHEGEAQISATLVPDDDPATYANRVNYSTSRWSPGDTRTWDRWSNKDVADQGTIVEEAESIAEEIKTTHVEAKATVVGEDIERGDMVRVEKPEANLSRDMRVHRIVTRADGPKVVDDVLLSTRTVVRGDVTDRVRDIQRFNVAFQGSSVILQGGGARQPVNGSLNAFVPFRYPDVAFEHKVEVAVRGLPYRAYSSGADSGGDHTHLVEVTHPSHEHDISVTETSNQKDYSAAYDSADTQMVGNGGTLAPVDTTFSSIDTSNDVWVTVTGSTESGYSEPIAVIISMHDGSSTLSTQVDTVSMDRGSPESFTGTVAIGENDRSNSDVTIEVEATNINGDVGIRNVTASLIAVPQHDHSVPINTTSTTELGDTNAETSDASGPHTHPADPGIIEFPTETPTGCDLVVKGSTVASNIGTGEFETVVDITGELNQGQWNDIEVTSDSLGHIQATTYVETYKQIGGGN